jgi:hypothetical protein
MKRPVVLTLGAAAAALLVGAVGASAHSGFSLTRLAGVHSAVLSDETTQSPEPSDSPEPTETPEAAPTAEPTEAPEAAPTTEPTEAPEAADNDNEQGDNNDHGDDNGGD